MSEHKHVYRPYKTFCACGSRGPSIPEAEGLYMMRVSGHDTQRGAQDARSASPEPGAYPDVTAGKTEAGNVEQEWTINAEGTRFIHRAKAEHKAAVETVALVRRLRNLLTTDMRTVHPNSCTESCRRESSAISAADAWLAAREKYEDKVGKACVAALNTCWEPCEGEHVETTDGLWMREVTAPAIIKGFYFCQGEHRRALCPKCEVLAEHAGRVVLCKEPGTAHGLERKTAT